jgi:nitroreductase
LIERAIETASSAPSGANFQPWTFVAVSDPRLKRSIREAAEREEQTNYTKRMPREWLEALEPLGTNWEKPFLESAPWLVVVFSQSYTLTEQGGKRRHYYVPQSVGIACGLFIAAIHNMGLVTLTHTPSPMGFLSEILERPSNEKPYMLFPVGFPAENAVVPELAKKPLEAVSVWH